MRDRHEGLLAPTHLQHEYTYVAIMLSCLLLPIATLARWAATAWKHHLTVGHLPVADPKWRNSVTAKF